MDYKGILLPYQKEIYEGIEKHKYSVILAARQTGKSFIVSLWAFFRALELPNHTILVISPSERQSKNLIDKVKMHIQAVRNIKYEILDDTKLNSLEIRFPNNSKIVALPSKPETVRGFSGDVIMDEAAFFEQGMEVYKAVFPTITRKEHYKLIAISTPKGKTDLFYYLWTIAEENNDLWFKYKLNIYDAVKKGLDVDIEKLRQGIKDEDAWKSEYLCEFIDELGSILPYELIQSCEEENILVNDLRKLDNIYVGVDIGRKKDLTVITAVEKVGSVLFVRKIEELKNMPYHKQLDIISHFCQMARKVAIDETGLGNMLAEELERRFPSKVIKVNFSAKTKEELASRLKTKFQDRNIRIPIDKNLREDLHSVKKSLTPAGNIKIEGSTADSHADRFWSLALAVHAADFKRFDWGFKFLKARWL